MFVEAAKTDAMQGFGDRCDLGEEVVAENAIFDIAPPAWGRCLPAHGAMRVLVDGAFTSRFDEVGALVWLAVLGRDRSVRLPPSDDALNDLIRTAR